MSNQGKFKNHVAINSTVTMSGASQAQSEIILPKYGDIAGIMLTISQKTDGTLVNGKTLDYAIKELVVKDRSGEQLLQSIRGQDLLMLCRYRNKGRNRTIPTTSSTSQKAQFYLPLNIEKKDQEAKVSLTVAPYSDMDDSGATGGELSYSIVVFYYDSTVKISTETIARITKSLISGTNTLGLDLPKGVFVDNILFKIGTESNLSTIIFTGDGNKELDDLTPEILTAFDNEAMISGHVDGEFSLYNSSFYSDPSSRMDFKTSGSDTVELFIVHRRPIK